MSTAPKAEAFFGVCTYYQAAAKRTVVGQRGTGCCRETISWVCLAKILSGSLDNDFRV